MYAQESFRKRRFKLRKTAAVEDLTAVAQADLDVIAGAFAVRYVVNPDDIKFACAVDLDGLRFLSLFSTFERDSKLP